MSDDTLLPPEKIEEYLNDDKKFKLYVIQTLQEHKIQLRQVNTLIKFIIIGLIITIATVLGVDCNKIINLLQFFK